MAGLKAESKCFKIEPSQPKLQPNFSKKKVWIPLDFLVRIEPFQALIVALAKSKMRSWLKKNGLLSVGTVRSR